MKNQTHYNQMITAKTRKLLDKLCKKSKLSKPMQLEKIVEEESNKWKELSKNPLPRVSY
mgnify:FL=1|jgi:hypothetical protein